MTERRTATTRKVFAGAVATMVSAGMLTAGPVVAQDDAATMGEWAGLDKDLSGVTIRMANIGGAPYENMYASIPVFEEATGADVEIVFLGDGFEIDRYLKTNYAAGTEDFDVAWSHTSFMAQYTPFVEPLQNWFSEEELAAYQPSIIEAATINGDLQVIPRHSDISSMHYRVDLFEDPEHQAAFEEAYGYPLAVPTTIDQMTDMAEYFVGADAVTYGTQWAGKEEGLTGRFYELLFANGGDYFDENLQPIFDSEAGVMTAQWMQDMYANGLVPPDLTNFLWPEVAQNFCNGDVAFFLEWPGWYSFFQGEDCPAIAGNFGLARGPQGAAMEKHTGWAGSHAMSIAAASENKEAAAQLVKFLTSERAQYDEAKLGLLPARVDAFERIKADSADSEVALDAERLALHELMLTEDFTPVPPTPDWISFSNVWFPTLQAIILGDLSAEDGVAKGVEDTLELWESLGY